MFIEVMFDASFNIYLIRMVKDLIIDDFDLPFDSLNWEMKSYKPLDVTLTQESMFHIHRTMCC